MECLPNRSPAAIAAGHPPAWPEHEKKVAGKRLAAFLVACQSSVPWRENRWRYAGLCTTGLSVGPSRSSPQRAGRSRPLSPGVMQS